MRKDIEINAQFVRALELMEEGNRNVFITGRAGTGKSTLLEYFRSITKKNVVVLAPTGVAAVNIGGQTIHSFFGFRPNITTAKVKREAKKRKATIYKKLDAIVIDEISMVRADLLDCIDEFMRIKGREPGFPFGGAQMIFIGDLYQIPPVIVGDEKNIFTQNYESEYFFDALVYSEIDIEHLELEKIYRQTDQQFIDLLNRIRNNTVSESDLNLLDSRVINKATAMPEEIIYLTTTNAMAEDKNQEELSELAGKPYLFEADIKGEIDRKSFPADEFLVLKKQAQVMLLNNDAEGRWINGTIGTVIDIDEEKLIVRLIDGSAEEVTPHKWTVYHFFWDEEAHAVGAESLGSFKQYPVKLAWAITIHKSQGKTFENVVIDLGRGAFATGQLYVAISRCRSLNGIFLKKKVKASDIRVDSRVMRFITGIQYELSEEKLPLEEKVNILEEAVENEVELTIVYLKNTDEKSERAIRPVSVGMMEYRGKSFLGLTAHCAKRNEMRTFRIDRILEIRSGKKVFQVERSKGKNNRLTPNGVAGCIDVETTGLNSLTDEVIELALVLFSYDANGITGYVDSYCGLREPNCDISPGAQRVHGLTLDDLIGHTLDKDCITEMIEQADFLVAHNASFDKGFVTKLFPAARKKRWLCSMRGVKWSSGRSLQELLAVHHVETEQAHRALTDVHALLSLLSRNNDGGKTYFAEMYNRRPLR